MGDNRTTFSMGDSANLNPPIWPPPFYSKLSPKPIVKNNSSRNFARMPSYSRTMTHPWGKNLTRSPLEDEWAPQTPCDEPKNTTGNQHDSVRNGESQLHLAIRTASELAAPLSCPWLVCMQFSKIMTCMSLQQSEPEPHEQLLSSNSVDGSLIAEQQNGKRREWENGMRRMED